MKRQRNKIECQVCGKVVVRKVGTLVCGDRCRQRRRRFPLLFPHSVTSPFSNARYAPVPAAKRGRGRPKKVKGGLK